MPNAEDGVAGVTQDAVPVGGSHVYRFRPERAGTFWYHAHQLSHDQVERGLLGALVVDPPAAAPDPATDVVALTHVYAGRRTVAGRHRRRAGARRARVPVRVRVVNTDNGPIRTWVDGAPFRVLAVDGNDVHEPAPVSATAVDVTAGGAGGPGGGAARRRRGPGVHRRLVRAGRRAARRPGAAAPRQPEAVLDLLHYGTPAPLGFDPASAARSFDVRDRPPPRLRRRPPRAVVDGQRAPVPGHADVHRGDRRRRADAHHQHQRRGAPDAPARPPVVVLARDGVAASGSPWWVDSLEVGDGESYDVAFVADNPGIWSDHCHNLIHAADGLVVHLMYAGVAPSYRIGGDNVPE